MTFCRNTMEPRVSFLIDAHRKDMTICSSLALLPQLEEVSDADRADTNHPLPLSSCRFSAALLILDLVGSSPTHRPWKYRNGGLRKESSTCE